MHMAVTPSRKETMASQGNPNKSIKRKRARAARESARNAEARKRQEVLRYTEDGTRIGDDGYPMTAARWHLHHLCNAMFYLMCLCFLAAAICMINSYFQNQTITDWDLVWIGGNMFNGLSVGTLLRVESLFLLYMTIVFLFTNQRTMAWMYDGDSKRPVMRWFKLMLIPSVLYFIGFLIIVGIPDPASLIGIVVGSLLYKFLGEVEAEKGTLKKAVVAREEIKR